MFHYQRSLLYCFSSLSELSPEAQALRGLKGRLELIFLHKGQPEIVVDCRAEDMCVSKDRVVVPLAAAVYGKISVNSVAERVLSGVRRGFVT
jgi:hypothetical protein